MADPAANSCNSLDHASLIATVGEQSRLIGQLFAKIQDLERKLEVAQQAAHDSPASQNLNAEAPNFAAPGESYVGKQDYSSPAPSVHQTKKAQTQRQPCHYGSNCTREQCWYEHPSPKSAGTSRSSTSVPKQNQPATNSTKRNKQECRYGINCTRQDCRFEHPVNRVLPESVTPEPQPHQDISAEAPAEVGNWDTNQDLSSWDATPTNDWGVPVDNSWGPPTQADNGWGDVAETSWSVPPASQHKPSTKNSRSASVNTSREGSVSNTSTDKSQGQRRKTRGKGSRADSGSVTTESTPMSPTALAPSPMSVHVESIPAEMPLSPPSQPTDQTSSFNELNTPDEMNTPTLDPAGPSSSSEPEAPSTPKASWSDEPNIDVVYFPDPPPGLEESQSSVPEGKDMNTSGAQPIATPVNESIDLAPSELYSTWGVTGTTASDWGLDPTEFLDTIPTDNKTSSKKLKSKGKQKETFSTGTKRQDTTTNSSSNLAAQSGTRTPFTIEPNEPEPAPKPAPPEPPQAVPHDQIPDWLLGADEDAHAALGIPRAASPKPEASSAPPRLAPTNPAPRPPLSKLAGENFPSLNAILATKSSQSKDQTPSQPVFSPRPMGYRITRKSDTSSSSAWGKGSKSKGIPTKK
ncbi:hypothetical protein OPQ81_010886 [Rhizoctonia solani]|nr:hypothetical protein OPQ81_010886 [Rhizoctonia solani]